ncbi:hypothetical protein BegalDRAFT_0961 [Beggiatoa alba B18LD]|uniref:Uncharacterized protein n=1 Tax=Beggiatoa alba B18LD TaxID=395493 RepID=I3CE24_9GAMM|nr:hypothetical protein [Beggiatoa alba]EIJ41867.1 hypothetical protein BegalDRAFT_0961 [Beggiatoa alba B18LD]
MSKKTSNKQKQLIINTMKDDNASKIAKELAGSALSQFNSNKTTSSEVAETAAKVLASPKYSQNTKSLAGTVLSQKKP